MHLKGRKQAIFSYMLLNGIGSAVPIMLRIGFSLLLFEQDSSGVSAAYLEPASLLGMGCAGLVGGVFFKYFSVYAIGIGALSLAVLTLQGVWWYGQIHVGHGSLTLGILACIMSIEHSNGLAFVSGRISQQNQPFFFSTFQFFMQCFNVLAPIAAKCLVRGGSISYLLLLSTFIYTLRIISWCWFYRERRENDTIKYYGVLTGFKEIIQNHGLLCITGFRILSNIAMVAYMVSLPILVAKMAAGNPLIHARLYPYTESMIHAGFIISSLCGSWSLKRKPWLIVYFFKINTLLIVLSAGIAFYTIDPYYLLFTAWLYGVGIYLFRTATSVIAQSLTQRGKLAHVILAGDAVVKAFAYGVGSLIPAWMILPAIGGVIPPFIVCILCTLSAMGVMQPIVKIYLASLCKDNPTK